MLGLEAVRQWQDRARWWMAPAGFAMHVVVSAALAVIARRPVVGMLCQQLNWGPVAMVLGVLFGSVVWCIADYAPGNEPRFLQSLSFGAMATMPLLPVLYYMVDFASQLGANLLPILQHAIWGV